MAWMCGMKGCKSGKGACSHEKWLLTAIIIAAGIFALAKLLNWI